VREDGGQRNSRGIYVEGVDVSHNTGIYPAS
jgi:hypothetical protein